MERMALTAYVMAAGKEVSDTMTCCLDGFGFIFFATFPVCMKAMDKGNAKKRDCNNLHPLPAGQTHLISQDFQEIFIIPSGFESFPFHAHFGRLLVLEQIQCDSVD